jgi:hypothetical protein
MSKELRQYEIYISGTAPRTELIEALQKVLNNLKALNDEQLDEGLPIKWEDPAIMTEIY